MAQPQPQNATPPKTPETKKAGPPGDGWEDFGRPDIDGWMKAAEGLVVHGKIEGFFGYKVPDPSTKEWKDREAICIRVIEPVTAQLKGGQEIKLEQGKVLAVSMFAALEGLRPYLSRYQEGKTYVYFKLGKQVAIGGGRKVWKMDGKPKVKGPKGEAAHVKPAGAVEAPDDAGSVDDGEVPF
jgi:hypothetical protein